MLILQILKGTVCDGNLLFKNYNVKMVKITFLSLREFLTRIFENRQNIVIVVFRYVGNSSTFQKSIVKYKNDVCHLNKSDV